MARRRSWTGRTTNCPRTNILELRFGRELRTVSWANASATPNLGSKLFEATPNLPISGDRHRSATLVIEKDIEIAGRVAEDSEKQRDLTSMMDAVDDRMVQ